METIINGNSKEKIKDIADGTINLIVTSPPYFGLRCYGTETLGREPDPADYVANLFAFTPDWKRVLSHDGSLYLNIGDVYFGTKGFSRNTGKHKRATDHHYQDHKIVKPDGKWLQYKQLLGLPERLMVRMQEDGWILRNKLIWEKIAPLPSFSIDRRIPVYEYIYHFVKSPKYFFHYPTAKKLNNHRDVIRQGIEPFGKHQASFPEPLITPLILTTSRIGDTVLDPFAGSGTVGAVCKKTGRDFIGIELNPEYCGVAEQRLADVPFCPLPDGYETSSATGTNIVEG